MQMRSIRTNDDLTAAFTRVDALSGSEPDAPEGNRIDDLVDLIQHYEDKHFSGKPLDGCQ